MLTNNSLLTDVVEHLLPREKQPRQTATMTSRAHAYIAVATATKYNSVMNGVATS